MQSGPPYSYSSKAVAVAVAMSLSAWSVLCLDVSPAESRDLASTIRISVVVLPIARVTTIQSPATLTVAEEDIRQGYLDERTPSLFEIATNGKSGCLMTLSGVENLFTGVEVTIQGRTLLMGPQGGFIEVGVQGRQLVSVHYRFLLAPDARPGVYAWPFLVSVEPLHTY